MNNVNVDRMAVKPNTLSDELRKIAGMLDNGVLLDVILFVGQRGEAGYQMNPITQPMLMAMSLIDAALSLREATKRLGQDSRIQLL